MNHLQQRHQKHQKLHPELVCWKLQKEEYFDKMAEPLLDLVLWSLYKQQAQNSQKHQKEMSPCEASSLSDQSRKA
uniref:Uncharacterized protein n=1 Tax=Arundo donax TaxID=35708 RepID=A0A0A8XQR9_ARUDO